MILRMRETYREPLFDYERNVLATRVGRFRISSREGDLAHVSGGLPVVSPAPG